MKRFGYGIRKFAAMLLAVCLILPQGAVSTWGAGTAGAYPHEAEAGSDAFSPATASNAERVTGENVAEAADVSKAVTASASDALFDEDGFLLDGEIVDDMISSDADYASPSDAEELVDGVIPNDQPKAEAYPAVTLTETVDDLRVTVSAEEGILPKGVSLVVTVLKEQDQEQYVAAVSESVADEGGELYAAKAIDISLYDREGGVLEPDGSVQVSIENIGLDVPEDSAEEELPPAVDVFRVSDDLEDVTKMETTVAEQDQQVFETDHFTIYVVGSLTTSDGGYLVYDGQKIRSGYTISVTPGQTLNLYCDLYDINVSGEFQGDVWTYTNDGIFDPFGDYSWTEITENGVTHKYYSMENGIGDFPGSTCRVTFNAGDYHPYFTVRVVSDLHAFTVRFDNAGSSSIPTLSNQTYGTVHIAPYATKNGYTFGGWECSDGHVYQAGEEYTVTGNLTMTGIWIADTTWEIDLTNVAQEQEYPCNDSSLEPKLDLEGMAVKYNGEEASFGDYYANGIEYYELVHGIEKIYVRKTDLNCYAKEPGTYTTPESVIGYSFGTTTAGTPVGAAEWIRIPVTGSATLNLYELGWVFLVYNGMNYQNYASYRVGTPIERPQLAAPEGYGIVWYSNSAYTQLYDFSAPVNQTSVRLYGVSKPLRTITWKNYDGTVLYETQVPEDDLPVYEGETPVKTGEDGTPVEFLGWWPEVARVTGDTVYTAAFYAGEDTTWQEQYDYTLGETEGEPSITLKTYLGSDTSVVVPGYAIKDGIRYRTVIREQGPYRSVWYDPDGYLNTGVTDLVFEDGVLGPVDGERMFAPMNKLRTLDVSGIDFSRTTSLRYAFENTTAGPTIEFGQIDTSNVKNFHGMFNGSTVYDLDLSAFDMSAATDAGNMLYGARNLSTVQTPVNVPAGSNIELWDEFHEVDESGRLIGNRVQYLPEGTDASITLKRGKADSEWLLYYDYEKDSSNETVYLERYLPDAPSDVYVGNTAVAGGVTCSVQLGGNGAGVGVYQERNITSFASESGVILHNAESLFKDCISLSSVDLSCLDMQSGNIKTTAYMFDGCVSLASIQLDGLNTSEVTDMSGMFWNCSEVTELDLSVIDLSGAVTVTDMLTGMTMLEELRTPVNAASAVELPAPMYDENGMEYQAVPAGLATSLLLTKTKPVMPVEIISQPENMTVEEGVTVQFHVGVSDVSAVVSWQWQYKTAKGKNWYNSPAAGADTDTLTVEATLKPVNRNGYSYRCIVTGLAGNVVTSEPATFSVLPAVTPAEIISQPESMTVTEGDNVSFAIGTSGDVASYQWQYKTAKGKNWYDSPAIGADTNILAVEATISSPNRNGYSYRCKVTGADGVVLISESATLRVIHAVTPAEITMQPQSVEAIEGTAVTFTVETSGDVESYQWQYKTAKGRNWYDSPAAGADTNTLAVGATLSSPNRNGYSYRCKVTGTDGNVLTSESATLTVFPAVTPAEIISQPQSVEAIEGATVTFTIETSGDVASYQWQYKIAKGKNWHDSPAAGGKTNILTVEATLKPINRNGYSYRCVVTGEDGSAITSGAASLTVTENTGV